MTLCCILIGSQPRNSGAVSLDARRPVLHRTPAAPGHWSRSFVRYTFLSFTSCSKAVVSNWYFALESRLFGPGRHFGENQFLKLFNDRLLLLAAIPISIVFVIDGMQRPLKKHNKRTRKMKLPLLQGMEKLVRAIGFCWWQVSIVCLL